VHADVAKWKELGIKPVPISHTNSFQRSVKSSEECSGEFYVAHNRDGIQVLVDVTDDTVVRNIEPDDIKAHWRSTSVEICIDPTPRSEDTFNTLKLGIFPQDTAGKVRAARDADARPGELGQIQSKIRLASRINATGYTVEAHIPWSEILPHWKFSPEPRTRLGFNVIIYHAGKRDARPGEDVGKSRLAWSFWPGVPGRPEVWGLAILEQKD
jgi:Carbohydrate family 9 binding domain-like